MTMTKAKRAIVTGASSGIGREIARQLAEAGWQVLATARRAARLQELAEQAGDNVIPFAADITADGAPKEIIAAAGEKLGGLDLLVNNAGTSWVGQFADMPTEDLDEVLSLNVRALMLMCREAVDLLTKSSCPQIINVASVVGHWPMQTIAVYCASKAAVIMFTKVLAKELSPHKIRVNLLSPTGTNTEIFAKAGTEIDPTALVPPEDVARMALLMTDLPESIDLGEVTTDKRFEPIVL